MFKSLFITSIAAGLAASVAGAATVNISVTGQIAEQPAHIRNAAQPFALTDICLALGDAVSFYFSFDTDAVAPISFGGQIPFGTAIFRPALMDRSAGATWTSTPSQTSSSIGSISGARVRHTNTSLIVGRWITRFVAIYD